MEPHRPGEPALPAEEFQEDLFLPLGGREPFQKPVVRHVRVSGNLRTGRYTVHVLGEHGSDGMHGVVPIQPFLHQPGQCQRDRDLVAHRDLSLHDGVNRCMQMTVWQADALSTVVLFHQCDPLRLVHRQPLGRIGSISRIVFVHVTTLQHAQVGSRTIILPEFAAKATVK